MARARWAAVDCCVRPTTVPRAAASQCGANRPPNAGTKATPPLSSTELASVSTSALLPIRPRLSRSHCTALPATATLPSSAHVTPPSASCHAGVVSRPRVLATRSRPVFISRKQPVP